MHQHGTCTGQALYEENFCVIRSCGCLEVDRLLDCLIRLSKSSHGEKVRTVSKRALGSRSPWEAGRAARFWFVESISPVDANRPLSSDGSLSESLGCLCLMRTFPPFCLSGCGSTKRLLACAPGELLCWGRCDLRMLRCHSFNDGWMDGQLLRCWKMKRRRWRRRTWSRSASRCATLSSRSTTSISSTAISSATPTTAE